MSEQILKKLKEARALREELLAALEICDNMITDLEHTLGMAVMAEAIDRQNPEHFYQTTVTLKGDFT